MPLMLRGSNDQGNNNWHRLWESNRNSCLQAMRDWLQQLSNSPASPGTLLIPPFTLFGQGSRNVNQFDDPIAKGPIPPFVLRHGEETGGASKADEGAARPRRTLAARE